MIKMTSIILFLLAFSTYINGAKAYEEVSVNVAVTRGTNTLVLTKETGPITIQRTQICSGIFANLGALLKDHLVRDISSFMIDQVTLQSKGQGEQKIFNNDEWKKACSTMESVKDKPTLLVHMIPR